MPVLDNLRWECFAKDVALGKTYTDAYKSIGGKAKDKAKAGAALASHAEIQQRVMELQQRVTDTAVERAPITKGWILDKLRENAEKGLALPGGSAVANRALELLGKELGMFQDPANKLTRTVRSVTDLSLQELDALLAESLGGRDAGSIVQ